MNARNDVVRRILDESEIDIAKRIENDKGFYRELLKKLIIQVNRHIRFLSDFLR